VRADELPAMPREPQPEAPGGLRGDRRLGPAAERPGLWSCPRPFRPSKTTTTNLWPTHASRPEDMHDVYDHAVRDS
jgi:hypothetical protein